MKFYRKKLFKRFAALFLCLVMVFSMISSIPPVHSFAQDGDEQVETVEDNNPDVTSEDAENAEETDPAPPTEEDVTEDTDVPHEDVNTEDNESNEDTESTDPVDTTENTEVSEPIEEPERNVDTSNLSNMNFDSMRLIVGTDNEGIFDENAPIVSSFRGLYMLQYNSIEEAKVAYVLLSEKADFIEVDTGISIAEGEAAEVVSTDTVMTEENNAFAEAAEAIESTPIKSYDIAVIDTGAYAGGNVVDVVSMLGDNGDDVNGHGTRMIQHIVKYAPDAKILAIKAIGDDGIGDMSAVYAAIQYAMEHNVKIINLSLSAKASQNNSIVEDAIREAANNGITVVAAAGNNSNKTTYYIPGGTPGAYVVGAADALGKRVESSNWGDNVRWNVKADSTSEAAAIMSGILVGGIKDNHYDTVIFTPAIGEGGLRERRPDESELFTVSDGTVSVGRFNWSLTDLESKFPNVFKLVQASGGWWTTLLGFCYEHTHHVDGTPDTNYTDYAFAMSSGAAQVRDTFSVDGKISYCFDITTPAKYPWSPSSSLSEAGIKGNESLALDVAKASAKLTENNFQFFKDNASSIAKAWSGHGWSFSKSAVEALLKSDDETAKNFRRWLVQQMVWWKMNKLDLIEYSPSFTSSGYYDKDGVWHEPDTIPETVGICSIIDFSAMYSLSLNAYASGSDAWQRQWSYVINPGQTITLSGQEGEDVLRVYETNGYFGTSGGGITVTRSGSNVLIKCSDNPTVGDFGWQTAGGWNKNILSSKPYQQGTSGQFIVNVSVMERIRAKIKVEYGDQYVSVSKSSALTSITNGNSCYSLAGAQYKLEGQAGNGSTITETLTLDANGNATSTKKYKIGTEVSAVEVKAPKGYLLDTTKKKLTVNKEASNNKFVFSDMPVDDPGRLTIKKASAPGLITSSSAVFRLDFYPNDSWSGSPTRTWYYKSIDGKVLLRNSSYLDTSKTNSDLFTTPSGAVTHPLGTYKLTEVEAPTGYKKTDFEMFGKCTQPTAGGLATFTWDHTAGNKASISYESDGTAVIDNPQVFHSIEIEKNGGVREGDSTMAGIEVTIYNRSGKPVFVKDGDGTRSVADGAAVETLVLDAKGHAKSAEIYPAGTFVPVETKTNKWYEKSDLWYNEATGKWVHEPEIIIDLQDTPAVFAEKLKDNIRVFDLDLDKYDLEAKEFGLDSQGNATLEGAEFELYNRSKYPVNVLVDGELKKVAANGLITTLVVGKNGKLEQSIVLPLGTYGVIETKAPEGMNLPEDMSEKVIVGHEGDQKQIAVFGETVKRGKVVVVKQDKGSGDKTTQNYPLGGIKFVIVNQSKAPVIVKNLETGKLEKVPVGSNVVTITTKWDATREAWIAETPEQYLPYGHYLLKEVPNAKGMANDYYHLNGEEFEFDMTEDGEVISNGHILKEFETTYKDAMKRFDVEFYKKMQWFDVGMMNVPFLVTNNDTGEHHIIVTNINGTFNSKYPAHAEGSANLNDWVISEGTGLAIDNRVDATKLVQSGVWFDKFVSEETGEVVAPGVVEADNGAFTIGSYTFQELYSTSNMGRAMIKFDVTITNDMPSSYEDTVRVGTKTNKEDPSITTTALDSKTNWHLSLGHGEQTIIDTVHCMNLVPTDQYGLNDNLKYRLVAKLMTVDSEGKYQVMTIDGKPIEGTSGVFDAEDALYQDVDVVLTFNADEFREGSNPNTFEYRGRTVVVYEELYTVGRPDGRDETPIAKHFSWDDPEQQIHFPKITSVSLDAFTGDKVGTIGTDGKSIVRDTVHYENVLPGLEYIFRGELMNRETGAKTGIAVEKRFTASASEGDEVLEFVFDSVEDVTYVAFEELYVAKQDTINEAVIAIDDTLDNEAQSVYFPKIRTSAVDGKTSDHVGTVVDGNKITDTIDLKNLVAGEVYTIRGVLHVRDNATGADLGELKVNGESITAERVITSGVNEDGVVFTKNPETNGINSYDAVVTLDFAVDASKLEGVTAVVFEKLIHADVEVDRHEDINDESQSIHFPKIRTSVKDNLTGDEVGTVQSNELTTDIDKLIDTVSVENLVPGQKYALFGILMDKDTGKALLIDGKTIEGSKTFVATVGNSNGVNLRNTDAAGSNLSGTVEIVFDLDARSLENKTIVVFEKLYHEDENGVEVTRHEDINDAEQTIFFPEIKTNASDVNTDDHVGTVEEEAIVNDWVDFKNLIADKEYTVSGKLHVRDDVTGKEIPELTEAINSTASKTFTFAGNGAGGVKVSGTDEADFRNIEVAEVNGHLVVTGQVLLQFKLDSTKIEGYTVVAYEDLLHNGVIVETHTDISDESQAVHYPWIRTSAYDALTEDHVGTVVKDDTIVDVITYKNLIIGEEYTLSGILHIRDNVTGKDLGELKVNGETVTAERTFKAGETDKDITAEVNEDGNRVDGTVTLNFNLDASELEGVTVVVFEKLLHKNPVTEKIVEVDRHEDINDEAQSIHYPKIRTSAMDCLTGDEVGTVTPNANSDEMDSIRDRVQVWNVLEGHLYSVEGIVMDRDTGKPIKDGEGNLVTQKVTFTVTLEDEYPEWVSWKKTSTDIDTYSIEGYIDLYFGLNASNLANTTVVVFEKLFHENHNSHEWIEVTRHEDLSDHDQTLHYPEIKTTASDGYTHDHVGTVVANNKIVDVVNFNNLVKGMKYTLNGEVHLKTKDGKDGGILRDAQNNPIVLEGIEFVAGDVENFPAQTVTTEEEVNGRIRVSGTYTLEFELDASTLEGQTAVVYETLLHNGVEVFVHADITDEDQTIHYPMIRTKAIDEDTGTWVGKIFGKLVNWIRGDSEDKTQTIIDTVEYWNLIPGMTYEFDGTLMNKDLYDENDPYACAIQKADAPITLKATKADGTVEVKFSVDSSVLTNANAVGGSEGVSLVVFEKLWHGIDNALTENGDVHPEDRVEVTRHEDATDEDQSVNEVGIRTIAKDAQTEDHVGTVPTELDDKIIITDRIELTKLVRGERYIIKGILVDQTESTKDNIVYLKNKNGEEITAQITIQVPDKDDFSQSATEFLEFKVDNELVQGKAITVFETLYYVSKVDGSEIEIGFHKNIEDASQSVYFPTGKTNATDDNTNLHLSDAAETVTITDDVYFQNLLIGEEYTISGELRLNDGSENGAALSDEGAASSVTFIAGETLIDAEGNEITEAHDIEVFEHKDGTLSVSGYLPIHFTVNTAELAGQTVVAFETFKHNDVKVFVHADINDLPQTIKIPKIGTMAHVGDLDETSVYDDENNLRTIEITDDVSYSNLWTVEELKELHEQGKVILNGKVNDLRDGEVYNIEEEAKYTMVGYLMDLETGERILDKNGNACVGYTVFVAEETEGTVPVVFTLNLNDYTDEQGNCYLEGKTLVVFEDLYAGEFTPETVDESKHIAQHHELEDVNQDIRLPKGRTHANGVEANIQDAHSEEELSRDHEIFASETMVVNDRVTYENLHGGTEYTVVGQLMNRDTEEPILDDEGNEIVSEVTFTTEGEYDDHVSGYVDVVFEFSGVNLAGTTMVAFEKVYRDGIEIIVHADIKDDAQTVHVPKIGTLAWAENGIEDIEQSMNFHETLAGDKVVIYDRVSYENLKAGEVYTMRGVVAVRGESEEDPIQYLKADGSLTENIEEAMVVDKTFIASQSDVDFIKIAQGLGEDDSLVSDVYKDDMNYVGVSGTVTLTFEIDASALAGKTIVFFESLYNSNSAEGTADSIEESKLVAEHKDINDEAQAIYFPLVETDAYAKDTGIDETQQSTETTVIDVVRYYNLHVGEEYEVVGKLMIKSIEKPLLIDGKEVTASKTFTPAEPDGEIELEFVFDSSALAGEVVVAYEDLYRNGVKVGTHSDINDEDQSVNIIDIKTIATVENAKEAYVSTNTKLVDTVSYTGLKNGETYALVGVLVDKSTGKYLKNNGKDIRAEVQFIPEEANGTVQMVFEFDSTKYGERDVVVYEYLYRLVDGKFVSVANHADIDDANQTVHFKEVPKTGDENESMWKYAYVGGGACVLVIAGLVLLLARKKRNKDTEEA